MPLISHTQEHTLPCLQFPHAVHSNILRLPPTTTRTVASTDAPTTNLASARVRRRNPFGRLSRRPKNLTYFPGLWYVEEAETASGKKSETGKTRGIHDLLIESAAIIVSRGIDGGVIAFSSLGGRRWQYRRRWPPRWTEERIWPPSGVATTSGPSVASTSGPSGWFTGQRDDLRTFGSGDDLRTFSGDNLRTFGSGNDLRTFGMATTSRPSVGRPKQLRDQNRRVDVASSPERGPLSAARIGICQSPVGLEPGGRWSLLFEWVASFSDAMSRKLSCSAFDVRLTLELPVFGGPWCLVAGTIRPVVIPRAATGGELVWKVVGWGLRGLDGGGLRWHRVCRAGVNLRRDGSLLVAPDGIMDGDEDEPEEEETRRYVKEDLEISVNAMSGVHGPRTIKLPASRLDQD
ncbi:outer membrane protein assembly factor BamB [Striga asiatica]|uniref:Outer membrane protein assembly factor BamB n=1 Tax=Striga asiatica TaxID=4170 RepID=A0A5A7PD00_STRAF|nr:outer membrane protein assembly factor BamB [Striga asiatica]